MTMSFDLSRLPIASRTERLGLMMLLELTRKISPRSEISTGKLGSWPAYFDGEARVLAGVPRVYQRVHRELRNLVSDDTYHPVYPDVFVSGFWVWRTVGDTRKPSPVGGIMITQSKLVEQLRDYQIRSQHKCPALAIFSPKPFLTTWADVAVAIVWALLFCVFCLSSSASENFATGKCKEESKVVTFVHVNIFIRPAANATLLPTGTSLSSFHYTQLDF
nr:Complement factor I light chain like [Ipomoea batatas]